MSMPEDFARDAEEASTGGWVEYGCADCGHEWAAKRYEGEPVITGETACPVDGCDGVGTEL